MREEDKMENRQDLDPAAEAEGRRLLAAAFETAPAGTMLAGNTVLSGNTLTDDEMIGAELLWWQARRRISRRRRVRMLVPAGAVAALGAAAALALALTATVAGAPSARAAVSAAAAKTSAESFQVTATQYRIDTLDSSDNGFPARLTGLFDLGRGLGEMNDNGTQIRIIGGHIYVDAADSPWMPLKSLAHGKAWVEGLVPSPLKVRNAYFAITQGFNGDEPINPGTLLGLLTVAASVTAEGPASGPGWTGAKYAYTEPLSGGDGPETLSGTVYVDRQGRVRRLVTADTQVTWSSSGVKRSVTEMYDLTFAQFGVRVSVTAPPASQVYNLSPDYLHVYARGSIGASGPVSPWGPRPTSVPRHPLPR